MSKNQKKVILGRIGDFEVYVYPYDFPDTVFIGKFPVSTKIDIFCVNQLIQMYNRAKAYLNGNWQNVTQFTKEAKMTRHSIVKAYDLALNEQRSKK